MVKEPGTTIENFFAIYNYVKSGPEGTRTPGLCHAKAALSQLSYGPKKNLGYPSTEAGRSKVGDAGFEPATSAV